MNNLMIFEERQVEVFEFEGRVLFNPYHVGDCLDIDGVTVRRHIQPMDEDEVMKLKNSDVASMNIRKLNNAGENFLTQEGVFTLIFKSRKPEAIKFQKWVTKEVLPSILDTAKALETVSYTPSECDLVKMRDGFCYTTTNQIADIFDREHYRVVAIIDEYLSKTEKDNANFGVISTNQSTSEFMQEHIKEITYLDSQNRPQKAYELDEYAFSMVALSFTGNKAERFKIAFINQFFNMRQALLDRTKALAIEQVLPQKANLRQYVYLIRNEGSGNVKIGVGQNPEQRLKQLQTGADADLTLEYKSMVCSNAYEIEAYMHKEFEEYNVRNEWFDIDVQVLIDELEQCEFVLESDFKFIKIK